MPWVTLLGGGLAASWGSVECLALTSSLRPLGDLLGTAGLVLAVQAVRLSIANLLEWHQLQRLLADEVVVVQVNLDWGEAGSSAWGRMEVAQPLPAKHWAGAGTEQSRSRTQEPNCSQAGEDEHGHQDGDADPLPGPLGL